MSRISLVRDRLERADGLAAVLDAAYDAFEDILLAIRAHENPADGTFIPLVMAAASAAEGRNAIVFAPSLPSRRLHPASTRDEPPDPANVEDITAALAVLSELLATRLTDAAGSAPGHTDQTACYEAARAARDIHSLLTGSGL